MTVNGFLSAFCQYISRRDQPKLIHRSSAATMEAQHGEPRGAEDTGSGLLGFCGEAEQTSRRCGRCSLRSRRGSMTVL
ncbi:hypothetical protein T11_7064 [Trichinella zimbabwensis]|uniref:Uncharacterized protein n=1 Tax=Trichinella zimbabwensis TaxID=268475 RepID=A0A0V1I4N3_9BILA|nr:hypothetical protein T11_7064 [Trichinella zimbabwensis]